MKYPGLKCDVHLISWGNHSSTVGGSCENLLHTATVNVNLKYRILAYSDNGDDFIDLSNFVLYNVLDNVNLTKYRWN